MASFRELEVVAIIEQRDDLVRVRASEGNNEVSVAGYPHMLGAIQTGNRIIVNMTGVELSLGTGGEGFILWNLDGEAPGQAAEGHIMKLRYTPWQMNVMSVESPESPHHDTLAACTSVAGMPVVVCGLHSQVAGVAAGIKAASPGARVGYVMTDGGALPLAWSRLVEDLKAARLVDVTSTIGHAFGGDFEAVNVFSALIALHAVAGADVAIVGIGPGGVGTSTAVGFSGMEVGTHLDAAAALGGKAVACLRISFHDDRARHRAVSHHSLTALGLGASRRCRVAIPLLPDDRAAAVNERLRAAGIDDKHELLEADGAPGVALLQDKGVSLSSMGRALEDAPEPWLAAAAAGRVAAGLL